jgi:hypothetical protein
MAEGRLRYVEQTAQLADGVGLLVQHLEDAGPQPVTHGLAETYYSVDVIGNGCQSQGLLGHEGRFCSVSSGILATAPSNIKIF